MELKLLWLYHDVMDLYGDRGNIQTLKYRCIHRGIDIKVDTCGINETKDFAYYDLIFMGGGADREQKILSQDLLTKKSEILKALEANSIFLLICGGYQLFGKYYTDANGDEIPGLGIYDYYTVAPLSKHRCVGNVIVDANLDGECIRICGFENHGGQTQGVHSPLGNVVKGHGNTYQSAYEGFYDGKVLGTYVHGPLLPKNAKLADFLIKKALFRKYGNVTLIALDDEIEDKAVNVIVERCLK